ncbi:MAG: membrane protein insertase YidC, partial [Proteobacteria bacterium]|nr:membrane protein insertase YidC [Pseudomonadota bacterium]
MMQNSNKDIGPNSSKGAFIAVILSVVFYFAWTQYLNKKYPDFNKQKSPSSDTASTATNETKPEASNTPNSSTVNSSASTNTNTASSLESAALNVPQLAEKDLTFENESAVFKFNQKHGSLESIILKNYRESIDPTSNPVQLLHRPFIIQGQPTAIGTSVKPVAYSAQRKDSEITFSYVEGNWQVIQKWQMPEKGYAGKLEIEFKNTSAEPANLLANTFFEMGAKNVTSKGSFFNPGSPNEQPRFLTQADGDDNFETMETFCKDRTHEVNEKNRKLDFFGFDYHYFALAFIPNVSFD